jgi:hypothetical protein
MDKIFCQSGYSVMSFSRRHSRHQYPTISLWGVPPCASTVCPSSRRTGEPFTRGPPHLSQKSAIIEAPPRARGYYRTVYRFESRQTLLRARAHYNTHNRMTCQTPPTSCLHRSQRCWPNAISTSVRSRLQPSHVCGIRGLWDGGYINVSPSRRFTLVKVKRLTDTADFPSQKR